MAVSRRARTYTLAIGFSFLFFLYRWSHHGSSSPGSSSSSSSSSSSHSSRPPKKPQTPKPPTTHTPPPDTVLTEFRPSVMSSTSMQGYTVVDHLYLMDGIFYFARAAEHARMERADIVSWKTGEGEREDWIEKGSEGESERWWHEVKAKGTAEGGGVKVLGGVTLLFHDEAGRGGYLPLFPHFAPEAYIPALKALSILDTPLPSTHPYVAPPPSNPLLPPVGRRAAPIEPSAVVEEPSNSTTYPARVIFPRCTGEKDAKGWKDDEGLNEWLLQLTLPGVPIEEKEGWERRAASGELIAFERIVIVDRWAAHRHPDTYQWKKMMSHMAVQPSLVKDWFAPFREAALETLGGPVTPPSALEDAPKKAVIVYLDRNRNSQSPRFDLDTHQDLIKALKTISGRAEVHQTVIMNMRKEEIVKLMSTATIVISPHAAEFIHTMWMPSTEFSTVMEIFDSGSFVRDNEMLSEMLHHDHLIVREDGIVPKAKWLEMEVERGPRWDDNIVMDAKIIMDRVVRIIDEFDSQALRDFESSRY